MTSTRLRITEIFDAVFLRATRFRLATFAVVWLAAVSFAHRALLGFLPRTEGTNPIEAFFFDTEASLPSLHYALFAVVVFNRRHGLRAALESPGAPFLGTIVSGLGLLVLGWARFTEQTDLEIESLVLILSGSALLAGGRRFLDRLVLPLALLWLARPWPPMLTHHLHAALQSWTAAFAQTVLDPFTEVVRSGYLLFFQGRVFEVIEGCSGLRLQITLLTATLVYLEFISRSRRQTLGVLTIAMVLGPFLNGLRVVSIMLNPLAEISQVHSAQGIFFVSFGIGVIALVDRLLETRAWPEGDRSWRRSPVASGGASAAPLGRLVGLATMALTALVVANLPYDRPRHLDSANWGLHEIRPTLGEWQRTRSLELDRQYMGSVAFRNKLYWEYTREPDDQTATVLVATDDRRRRDRSSLSPRTERLGSGWQIMEKTSTELEEPLGTASRSLQARGAERALVLHYRINESPLALEILRWLLAWDRWPPRVPEEIVTVRIVVPINPIRPAQARTALADLQNELHRALLRAAP